MFFSLRAFLSPNCLHLDFQELFESGIWIGRLCSLSENFANQVFYGLSKAIVVNQVFYGLSKDIVQL
jgi:hypothetical protein